MDKIKRAQALVEFNQDLGFLRRDLEQYGAALNDNQRYQIEQVVSDLEKIVADIADS
jgi:hypothetical protein